MTIAARAAGAATLVALLASGFAVARDESQHGAYAGQQRRAIKALSEQDAADLLAGHGAGFAKAAELNGYPGPAHTLELKDKLELTREQVGATEALMASHKARAKELGAALVEAERQLDDLFSRQQADAAAVDQAARAAGHLQAQLRAEHLKTHLAQTALLNTDQIKRYSVLRGYADPLAHKSAPAHGAPQRSHDHQH